MKYIKKFETTRKSVAARDAINNNLRYKIGEIVKIKNNDNIYIINNTTLVKVRPYFLMCIDDNIKPEMPFAIDIIPASESEIEKAKMILNSKKYNL